MLSISNSSHLSVHSVDRKHPRLSRLVLALCVLKVALALGTCGVSQAQTVPNGQHTAKDSAEIVARGVMRVAITRFDLPAFHWRTPSGEHIGPEIELSRDIGRLLKVGVQFIDDCATFDAVIDAVASGRADIGISKLSQTPRRILQVRFSEPYLTVRQALLFERLFIGKDTAHRTPEDALRQFSGTLAVIAHSSYVDFAHRNFTAAQIVETQNWEDAIIALIHGRVNAIYRDEFEIRRLLADRPALNVKYGSAALTDQKSLLSVAVCPTCVHLREFINFVVNETPAPFTIGGLLASARKN